MLIAITRKVITDNSSFHSSLLVIHKKRTALKRSFIVLVGEAGVSLSLLRPGR